MDVGCIYCGHHFTVHVNQSIMLYTLNLVVNANYFSVKLETNCNVENLIEF